MKLMEPAMRIRKFRDEDAAEASRVLTAAFRSFLGDRPNWSRRRHFPPRTLKQKNKPGGALTGRAAYVATEEGAIIGYASGTAHVSGFGTLEVIAVDPAYFGKNAGRLLFEALEKFWKRKKLRKAETCVSAHNKRAIIFYLKNGFIPVGYRKDHFMEGVDEILLDKFLV